MKFESSNPFLKNKEFSGSRNSASVATHDSSIIIRDDEMTISGTMNKSFLLLALIVAAAAITWSMAFNGDNVMPIAIGGAVAGLVAVVIAAFKPHLSAYLGPAYAIAQGLFLGAISAIFETQYPGIVVNAVGATFVTFMVCFGLYRFKIVKVTQQFRSIVIAATLAIVTFYVIGWVLSMFTSFTPIHHGNSLMSIGISVFVIIVAALNLFLDFDMIEKGAEAKQPKYMEWFGAIGLMVTLVWLYVEFLRLLSKLSSRD